MAEEGTDTPRIGGSSNNIVVSIHAIATFQALNDYLRPRLSGILSSSRFSHMLAALAAGRTSAEALFGAGSSELPRLPDLQAANGQANQELKRPERRRSQRLSAKASTTSLAEKANAEQPGPSVAPPSVASTATVTSAPNAASEAAKIDAILDGAGSETAINDDGDESPAEFMGGELDAEVIYIQISSNLSL